MSDNNKHYFHFTLGPVQGFVSQARRTRDFWAGSFILSWLAAVAMKAVHAQYPEKELEKVILFPAPDPEFMQWVAPVKGKQNKKGEEPKQGSIPNRFKAEVDKDFKPELVVQAVQEAWKALAKEVWRKDIAPIKPSYKTARIWVRQVKSFWDMSWLIVDDEKDSSALDRRKNWRTYTPPEESGVKCAMMDGWQELSGEASPNRNDMNRFWKPLRENGKEGMQSDLRENEALCAIAFIKRRFSRHFKHVKKDFFINRIDGKCTWTIYGWDVPDNVPSVTYMAAVHWLEQLLAEPRPNDALLKGFHELAYELTGNQYSEVHTEIDCLVQFKEISLLKKILALDGNVFFPTELENPNIFSKKDPSKAEFAKQTLSALKTITQTAKELKVQAGEKLDSLTPFYAILLMDGDSLGEKMSKEEFHYPITKGLEEFTKGVPNKIREHSGFLVYAGGDDVLAILPLEDAIPCAVALRDHYLQCFKYKAATAKNDERIKVDTTISAAIEFAHIHTPLTKVLKDSHKLLDQVAKEGSGRDALAVRVWKPGGLQIEWSQPWAIVLDEKKAQICDLAEQFKRNSQTIEDFSNKFFYKIRERFEILNPPKNRQDKYTDFSVFNDEKGEQHAINLMTMEYLNAYNKRELNRKRAEETVIKLMNQCRPRKRDKDHSNKPDQWLQVDLGNLADEFIKKYDLKKGKEHKASNRNTLEKFKVWEADAALLVRFLAQKGVGGSHE